MTVASVSSLLAQRRAAVTRRWLDRILGRVPAETAAFIENEKDRFANPMGHALSAAIEAIYDTLLPNSDAAALRPPLKEIVKIRCVQDAPPTDAVSFVFMLKEAIRDELGPELDEIRPASEVFDLYARIDQVALIAFDLFAECRETIYKIRVDEVKRTVSGVLRRANFPQRGADS